MEYTLFFSYQSDTKYEFELIKDVLNKEVKSKLLSHGIDLKVDYGMRDVAGNPDLLKTMLEKGEECDIFLADLTYVTKFTNSKKHKKYLPNPNVMLELGHAWNFHGDNHTIFIQNSAEGKAKELPVDLRGFRFPISYELKKDALEEDKISTRKTLCKDLTKAIKTVVNSIKENNKTKYCPFYSFATYQIYNQNEEFIKTKYFELFTNTVKDRLSQERFVTITGKEGCGKSRIIKEFILLEFSEQELNNTLYCKYSQTSSDELCRKLKELLTKELRRNTFFILDNCNDTISKEVKEILQNSNHKCLFIMQDSSNPVSIKINAREYIIDIIASKKPQQVQEILRECGYNLHHVLAVLNNTPYELNRYNVDKDSTTILEYLSLFSKVGFYNHFEKEFDYLCDLFKLDIGRNRLIIKQLIRNGYIISLGGFIFIESDAVANEYAKEMWQNGLEYELDFKELISKGQLATWFINRQIQIAPKNKECASFLKKIINTNFREIAVVDSKLGKDIIHRLVEIYPKEILASLELLYVQNKNYEFKEIYSPLWTLEIIAKKKELFDRAIMLLLSLRDGSSFKTDIKEIVAQYFKCISYDLNANVESFKNLYFKNHIDVIKNVYQSIFQVGYRNMSEEQKKYLRDMFIFLINIRKENKDWANNVIITNVLTARSLGIARQVFAEIRTIVKENETTINIAETLTNKIKWASTEDKKSIKALLKSIMEKDFRNMLYIKVVLFKNETLIDAKALRSAMSEISSEILQNKYWKNDIDVLLRGGRKYDANSLWFGYAISQQYDYCEELITQCLDLYKKIPIEEQSYGFITGLFHTYVKGNDYSVYKEKRNELLKQSNYINVALALSNSCENNITDLLNIKNALITNSLSLTQVSDLHCITLSETEYCSFATELINLNKEGADAGIKLLDKARHIYKDIDVSTSLIEIVNRYNYWGESVYNYDSTYSKLLKLLIYILKLHPNDKLAEAIIISMVKGCNNPFFNSNCSVVDLFQILIKQYQSIFLENIEPILFDDSFEAYNKRHKLEQLFQFRHEANAEIYLKWCEKNGIPAAEFLANFIPLLMENNSNDIVWTDEAMILMNIYSQKSCVLSSISKRLFDGQVSIAKYARLKRAYELLSDHDNETIRLWAIKQVENMEQCIQREREQIEIESIWDK